LPQVFAERKRPGWRAKSTSTELGRQQKAASVLLVCLPPLGAILFDPGAGLQIAPVGRDLFGSALPMQQPAMRTCPPSVTSNRASGASKAESRVN
jgi:hypothetical protein